MNSLATYLPDVDDLLSLDEAELGLLILQIMNERDGGLTEWNDIRAPLLNNPHPPYPQARRHEVEVALAEAWWWLRSQVLIVPDPRQGGSHCLVSRRGRGIRTKADAETYRRGSQLPRELFHEHIREEVWSSLLRGRYDTAVFDAFKEVEIAVRAACGYKPRDVGVAMMREAFKPNAGPLADITRPEAEQAAERDLFAGAIGSYKNPQSHRHVGIPSAEEAAEMIIIASHLLRIVDARKNAAATP